MRSRSKALLSSQVGTVVAPPDQENGDDKDDEEDQENDDDYEDDEGEEEDDGEEEDVFEQGTDLSSSLTS